MIRASGAIAVQFVLLSVIFLISNFSEKVNSLELGQEFADFFFQMLAGILVSDPAGAVE